MATSPHTPLNSPTRLIIGPDANLLDRNLQSLGERNLDVANAIRAATPAQVEWSIAADGSRVATLDGRALASRHQPRTEAVNFADATDLRDRAVIVVLGFGLGYHVMEFCERLGRSGLVVVLEPDIALLRAVLAEIDCTVAFNKANILFFRGDEQAGRYAERFAGTEGVLIQGVQLVEHPASRSRVAPFAKEFAQCITETVRGARVTAATGLARSAQTIRSILGNARHYIGGEGLAPIEESRRVASASS